MHEATAAMFSKCEEVSVMKTMTRSNNLLVEDTARAIRMEFLECQMTTLVVVLVPAVKQQQQWRRRRRQHQHIQNL
jgi:hypothetical protein